MNTTQNPGAGSRRFDRPAAVSARYAEAFGGLPDGVTYGQALAAFKRAAAYQKIPATIVQLVDVLFSWTKPDDWKPTCLPIVWPRNEKLARAIGVGVRQVQNLLDAAVRWGLISHHDSPNGHRGGKRGEDGQIKWAYGIVLSPIGTRYAEFKTIADRGSRDDETLEILNRRLRASRRHIRALAQSVIDHAIAGTDATEIHELARMACDQMRNNRSITLLSACVDQLEARAAELEAVVRAKLDTEAPHKTLHGFQDIAPSDEKNYIHSTTTSEPQTANAVTSSGLAKESSENSRSSLSGDTLVERDLDKHGVDPAFIESVTPEIVFGLRFDERDWGQVVAIAERLAQQNAIHRHAWHEACRLMGTRGAAAGVIATVHKYRAGEVDRPGAYLRGMSARAARGELNLGRTFHGFRDNRRDTSMRALHDGSDISTAGELARRAMARVRNGTSGLGERSR